MLNGSVQIYFDSMDSLRTGKILNADDWEKIFKVKYKNLGINAVISDSDEAGKFVYDRGESIFGNVPFIVYISAIFEPKDNFLFFTPALNWAIEETLKLALTENPKTKNIYIIRSGYSANVFAYEYIKSIVDKFENVNLVPIEDYSFDELNIKVGTLPQDGFIFYPLVFQDRTGKRAIPKDVAAAVAKHAHIPVYSYYSSLMGSGIVGGHMIDAEAIAQNMIKASVAVLNGQKVEEKDFHTTKTFLDWKQLQRFGLHAGAGGHDAEYINRPPSLMQSYGTEVYMIAAAVVLATMLSIWFGVFAFRTRRINKKVISEKRMTAAKAKLEGLEEMLGAIYSISKQPLQRFTEFHNSLRSVEDEDLRGKNEEIIGDIEEMSSCLEDFRGYFLQDRNKSRFSIRRAVLNVESSLRDEIEDVIIEFRGQTNTELFTYEGDFRRVLAILLLNAREAFDEKRIADKTVIIYVQNMKESGEIWIKLQDNAGGIAAGCLPKMFTPFFTTKGHEGIGFSLYLAKLIVEESLEGSIRVSNEGDGACFEIILPSA